MSSVVPLRSSSCQSPDLVLPRPFPSVLTTMAFDHSRRRWFGTCSCQPVPRGLPSSIQQLHTLGPPRPFALVAHHHRRTGRIPLPSPLVPGHCFRPFPHLVYLIEVQIAEQRRNDSPNAKDNLGSALIR